MKKPSPATQSPRRSTYKLMQCYENEGHGRTGMAHELAAAGSVMAREAWPLGYMLFFPLWLWGLPLAPGGRGREGNTHARRLSG